MGQGIDLQEDKKINLWISPVLTVSIFDDCVKILPFELKKKKSELRIPC